MTGDGSKIAFRLLDQCQEQMLQVHLVMATRHAKVGGALGGPTTGIVQLADQGLEIDAHPVSASVKGVYEITGAGAMGLAGTGTQVSVPTQAASARCRAERARAHVVTMQGEPDLVFQ